MSEKQKLELTWIGKDKRTRLEPRILIEDKVLSHRAEAFAPMQGDLLTDEQPKSFHDNLLIQGDNLLALKSLESNFSGQIKCVYIDPPFNTGEAFPNYDDGVEHSLWLSLMSQRLTIIKNLLSPDGHLFIHIDDNELAYLIVLCDELFGRKNRRSIITFKQSSVSGPKSKNPGIVTTANYIVWYSASRNKWDPKRVYKKIHRDSRYSKYIINYEEDFSRWTLENHNLVFAKSKGMAPKDLKKSFGEGLEAAIEEFVLSDPRRVVRTATVKDKDVNESARDALDESRKSTGVFRAERDDKDDYYFVNGEQLIFYSSKVQVVDGVSISAEALSNMWDDLLSNNLHKEGGVTFPKGKKPEALIKRILELSTSPGDLVLDSFLGSGTTAAVAQKMGRKWIGIELGDQCFTHVLPRLKKVIDGTDQDGISKAVSWRGGGGFRYYRLAPSLLKKDQWGNWVINPAYNGEMLSEAMCKHMGFTYAPSQEHFWMHGHSSETDFIYVTTGSLSHDQLRLISDEVGTERTLLICCKAFMADAETLPNLTLKKIPRAILGRCEWDNDDYSFSINLKSEESTDEPLEDQ